jgi:hypothetical protein
MNHVETGFSVLSRWNFLTVLFDSFSKNKKSVGEEEFIGMQYSNLAERDLHFHLSRTGGFN